MTVDQTLVLGGSKILLSSCDTHPHSYYYCHASNNTPSKLFQLLWENRFVNMLHLLLRNYSGYTIKISDSDISDAGMHM